MHLPTTQHEQGVIQGQFLSGIWTHVAVSISYKDNHYITIYIFKAWNV